VNQSYLPERLTGLIPIQHTSSLSGAPTIFHRCFLFGAETNFINSLETLRRKLRIFCASGVPAAYSIPA
jgi:hypothetical protein